ncbi:uncharacterized protein [Venturia canescens]|uniref:uncharacterized protein isoform X2 n=1 Tax=Venturia canescens TaxID=32260 RepID=UPI001C9D4109|nr:uncharacterized protein LOC122415729 isoform X2 [Venturia canescens]
MKKYMKHRDTDMSTSYSKCVVPHCGHVKRKQGNCIYAKFPPDVERCRLWLRIAGVEDLVYLPEDKLNNIRHICGCHFTNDQFINSSRKRLKRTAIPTLVDSRVVPLSDALLQQYPLQHDSSKNDASIDGIGAVANQQKTQVNIDTIATDTTTDETRVNTEAIPLCKENSLEDRGKDNEHSYSKQCAPPDTSHVETDLMENNASFLLETDCSPMDEPPAVKDVFLVRYNKSSTTREINMDGVIVEKARVIIAQENTSSMEIRPATDSKTQGNTFSI